MWRRTTWIFAAAALSVLAACASAIPKRASTSERREQYLRFAGPPVDSFTYLGRYYAWQPVGRLELVVWTTINDAYLITVRQPCVGLEFTNRIRLTSTARTITRGIDAVDFDGQHCFITQIRPVDYLAMKRATHSGP